MAQYEHCCTPSERHPGYCAECGEPLVPRIPMLYIPEPAEGETNPGNIAPGRYTLAELVDLLRDHKNNPEAIQFIADMMEE